MGFESYLRAIVSISALDKYTVQVVALQNTCRHREYCCAAARTEMEKALFFIIFTFLSCLILVLFGVWLCESRKTFLPFQKNGVATLQSRPRLATNPGRSAPVVLATERL